MRRLRTDLARLWLLLGLTSWLAAVGVQRVHELTVEHVRCVEHGEMHELEPIDQVAHASAHTHEAGPDLRAEDPRVDHDHGCALDGALLWALASIASATAPEPPPALPQRYVVTAGAPRGPPLAYAPKTSPPAIS
jgi:hypothetical protein